MATLIDSLAERFCLGSTTLTVAGRRWDLVHPRSVDELLEEEGCGQDDRLPYWARVWPSSQMLARRLATQNGAGRRLLELGCGAGLASLVAAAAGFDVVATDYFSEALEFVTANAVRHELPPLGTQLVDWREYPGSLQGFDVVVAADVLYERANAGLVAAALAYSLAPQGVGLLTDPGRSLARPFAAECRARGLACECIDLEQIRDGDLTCIIELYEIRRLAG